MNTRKPIFKALRAILGRGIRQAEVDQIDRAIDCMEGDDEVCEQLPRTSVSAAIVRSTDQPSRIGEAGIALIKRFEGCARLRTDGLVEAYPDPGTGADPWTIGWGATGRGVDRDSVWTQAQCDERLEQDLVRYGDGVSRALGNAPTTQAQFDAMVSFHYNTGAIARATLTKKHIAGDFEGAAREFARWNKAGGRVLKGLVRRRAAEARLYAS